MEKSSVGKMIATGTFLLLFSPLFASAATLAELQAQLATLMAQLSALQQGTIATPPSSGQATDAAPVSCPNLTRNFTRNLSRGMKGTDVADLQSFLITQKLLASDSATGFFGALTESAVKEWQSQQGIVSSGTPNTTGYGAVGPRTRGYLRNLCRVETIIPPTTTVVPTIQTSPTTPTTSIVPSTPTAPPNSTNPMPPVSCTPLAPQTQTLSCPTGQTGSITQTRTSSCATGATSPAWSVWQSSTNTCQNTVATSHQFSVSSPTTVLSQSQRSAVAQHWPDSPLGIVKTGSQYMFFAGNSNMVLKSQGMLDNPGQQIVSQSAIQNQKGNYNYYSGGPIYRDPNSGVLLMVAHAERWPQGDGSHFASSLGIAKSVDNGATWSDLGEIITVNRPYDPSNTSVANEIGSGGFVVMPDGYMYIYFRDVFPDGHFNDIAVARASLSEVLSAAAQNQTAVWRKYYCGQICGFNELGLGGLSSSLKNLNFHYPSVTYNYYLNKYLMVVGQPPHGNLYLLESSDGLAWGEPTLIQTQNGVAYQPTIVSLDDPTRTGARFYVYYVNTNSYVDWSTAILARRLICFDGGACTDTTLAQSSASFQASTGFSGTQNASQWSYRDSSGVMTFDAVNNRWQGGETYALLFAWGGHPGMNTDAVRRWTTPKAGSIRITGTAADSDAGGGDGVVVSIRKGTTSLWSQTIANGGASVSYDVSTTVQSGDTIDFVINKGSTDNSYDATTFDPRVELQ